VNNPTSNTIQPVNSAKERLDFIAFMKDNPTKVSAGIKSVPAGEFSLIPVGQYLLEDNDTIDLIAKWRNINANAYPTRFKADREAIKNWLQNQIISTTSRILFLVSDAQGRTIGHMGLTSIDNPLHRLEIDNVEQWEENLPPNTFSYCLKALIEWARTSMYVEGFVLRVFSSNTRAISFYRKNNFREARVIPMVVDPSSTENFLKLVASAESGNDCATETMLEMCYEENLEDFVPDSLILTAGPSISQYESYYAYDAALNGWNSEWSKYLHLLQHSFKEYIGVKYALATSSCTGAMHIALLALGIGEGDEVIVPDQTWVATANAVRYVQATPIFVDINSSDWTINPSEIERAITPRTKAVMPVHMYGHPANMQRVLEIANKHNLFVVEDAAPSIGAEFHGKKTGSFGHFAAFSFQGAKLMVTGEGGMLLTDDDELYLKAKKIWDQGRNSQINTPFWIDEKGLKYKMSNIQAALGLGQLNRIESLVAMKRRIFNWYDRYLVGNQFISLNHEPQNSRSIYWMSSIEVLPSSPVNRDQLISLLKSDNIDTRPVFPAISQYPIWDSENVLPRPIALHVGNNCMNLPSGVGLTEAQVKYICSRVNYHTMN
jgi:perosamine synthetase